MSRLSSVQLSPILILTQLMCSRCFRRPRYPLDTYPGSPLFRLRSHRSHWIHRLGPFSCIMRLACMMVFSGVRPRHCPLRTMHPLEFDSGAITPLLETVLLDTDPVLFLDMTQSCHNEPPPPVPVPSVVLPPAGLSPKATR